MVVASMMTACCMLVKSCEYEMTRLITAGCRWVMMVAHELTTIVNSTHTCVNVYNQCISGAYERKAVELLLARTATSRGKVYPKFIRGDDPGLVPGCLQAVLRASSQWTELF